ncbi:putative toxin [Mycobacteroides abscessus]|uniref:putative toxin n=1 Tax=Mycobacteroides abscessus TaxID=36809 RepID=UPI00232D7BA0|nr:putative toxin [Mycobacteroides abscessus]MDB2196271.1 putative toxin [Mycobacteroides abscessus subsp. abscessus]MDB2199865.1 putative toxin [Mycobacteroides abscessus subsp. abscessus]
MSGNERSTEQLTAVTDCRDLVRSAAAAQRLPSRDLDTSLVAGDERGRRVAAFAGGSVLVVGAVTALHNLYRSGDDAAELIAWSGLLLLAMTALGGGIKLAMWGARPVITALFDAAKARLTEFGRTVVAAGSVIAGALGMWWTFRGGYASWWQQVSGEHRWTLLLGVGQMLVAVAAGAALFTGGRFVTGLAKDALTDSGLLIERDRSAGKRRVPEGLWHPGLVAALIGGGLGLVLLAAGITPRLYVWITGPDVLPAVAAIVAVLVWGVGANLGWWKGLAGLWQWATDASHKAAATSGVVALLMFSAGGLGLGWFTPATVPQAHAQCPPDCGGGSNGSGSYGPDASQFQPPQMPGQMPDYQGGINQPALDQNGSISIYNTQAPSVSNNGVQGSSGQQGPQQGWDQPAHGTQIPDYQNAAPYTQGPGRPNPDFNPGSQGGQPNQGVQQQAPQQPQENPAQQPDQQPQQSDSQRIDDLTRQLQDQQQQSAQDRQRIDDLTKQLQQQNKQNQKQQSPRFPSKDDKKDRDQQDRDKQSGDNDLSALLLGAASTRRRKQDDQEQGPDTEALGQDAAQAAQSLPGDVQTYVQSGQQIGQSSGQAAQGFGSAAQAGASLASSAQSGAVNPQDAITVVQGVSQGIQGTADAINAGSQIVKTAQGEADQVAQAVGDVNPQLKPQAEQFTQLNDQASQVTDLVGQGAQLTSQGAGAVNSVSSLGASGMPTDAAGEAPAEMVGWATAASGPAGSGPATFGGPQPGLPAPADPSGDGMPATDDLVPLIAGQPVTIDQSVPFKPTTSGVQVPDMLATGKASFLPQGDSDTGLASFVWQYQGLGTSPTEVVEQTTEIWVNGEKVEPKLLEAVNNYTLFVPQVTDGDTILFKQTATIEWFEGNIQRQATGTLEGYLQAQNAPGTTAAMVKMSSGARGRQGMEAVGLPQNSEKIFPNPSTKKFRIPDVLVQAPVSMLGEVKNVGKLSLTQQLTEYLKYAKANGYAVHLFVRQGEGTQLSGPLQALVDSGQIVLHKVI